MQYIGCFLTTENFDLIRHLNKIRWTFMIKVRTSL